MNQIIKKAKIEFFNIIKEFGSDPYHLKSHVPEAEKWAKYLLKKFPKADEEVVLLAVWLHDIGHYPIPTEIDHAIRSEERARDFLEKENYPKDKLNKVLHCIRSHRCKDVLPNSTEAKIIAFIDSASHMTDKIYLDMTKDDKEHNKELRVYSKIERDYRDLGIFPEIQNELKELYESWKRLIKAFEKINLN